MSSQSSCSYSSALALACSANISSLKQVSELAFGHDHFGLEPLLFLRGVFHLLSVQPLPSGSIYAFCGGDGRVLTSKVVSVGSFPRLKRAPDSFSRLSSEPGLGLWLHMKLSLLVRQVSLLVEASLSRAA